MSRQRKIDQTQNANKRCSFPEFESGSTHRQKGSGYVKTRQSPIRANAPAASTTSNRSNFATFSEISKRLCESRFLNYSISLRNSHLRITVPKLTLLCRAHFLAESKSIKNFKTVQNVPDASKGKFYEAVRNVSGPLQTFHRVARQPVPHLGSSFNTSLLCVFCI